MKFNLCKSGSTFIPATASDKEKCEKIGQGEIVSCRSVDRDVQKLRKMLTAHRKQCSEQ